MWLVALLQLVAEIGVSWVTFGPDKQTKLALRELLRPRPPRRAGDCEVRTARPGAQPG